MTVDVTDRKEAEERVRLAETEFRAVFEGAMDAILVADDDGRYLAVNPAAGELLGGPPARSSAAGWPTSWSRGSTSRPPGGSSWTTGTSGG